MNPDSQTELTDCCEYTCKCCEEIHRPEFIVITGGPGAGKTALLESIKKELCKHVAVLPEAAGIAFKGGFWRLKSHNARLSSQRVIFHIQREMENLVSGENKWGLALCDRGILDGLAYWPDSRDRFWSSFHTDPKTESSRYKAIIHLRTPGLEHGYNHQNPLRLETEQEALKIDNKIQEIWIKHPNYKEVKSSESFLNKISLAIELIKNEIPSCCKRHLD